MDAYCAKALAKAFAKWAEDDELDVDDVAGVLEALPGGKRFGWMPAVEAVEEAVRAEKGERLSLEDLRRVLDGFAEAASGMAPPEPRPRPAAGAAGAPAVDVGLEMQLAEAQGELEENARRVKQAKDAAQSKRDEAQAYREQEQRKAMSYQLQEQISTVATTLGKSAKEIEKLCQEYEGREKELLERLRAQAQDLWLPKFETELPVTYESKDDSGASVADEPSPTEEVGHEDTQDTQEAEAGPVESDVQPSQDEEADLDEGEAHPEEGPSAEHLQENEQKQEDQQNEQHEQPRMRAPLEPDQEQHEEHEQEPPGTRTPLNAEEDLVFDADEELAAFDDELENLAETVDTTSPAPPQQESTVADSVGTQNRATDEEHTEIDDVGDDDHAEIDDEADNMADDDRGRQVSDSGNESNEEEGGGGGEEGDGDASDSEDAQGADTVSKVHDSPKLVHGSEEATCAEDNEVQSEPEAELSETDPHDVPQEEGAREGAPQESASESGEEEPRPLARQRQPQWHHMTSEEGEGEEGEEGEEGDEGDEDEDEERKDADVAPPKAELTARGLRDGKEALKHVKQKTLGKAEQRDKDALLEQVQHGKKGLKTTPVSSRTEQLARENEQLKTMLAVTRLDLRKTVDKLRQSELRARALEAELQRRYQI